MQFPSCIVEGRFLQFVLSECRCDAFVVEVTCSAELRAVRWRQRLVDAYFSEQPLSKMDEIENRLIADMYEHTRVLKPNLVLDTTQQSEDTCSSILFDAFSETTRHGPLNDASHGFSGTPAPAG